MYKTVDAFMESVINKNPGQEEFHQAVEEVAESVFPFIKANPVYDVIVDYSILESFDSHLRPFNKNQLFEFLYVVSWLSKSSSYNIVLNKLVPLKQHLVKLDPTKLILPKLVSLKLTLVKLQPFKDILLSVKSNCVIMYIPFNCHHIQEISILLSYKNNFAAFVDTMGTRLNDVG